MLIVRMFCSKKWIIGGKCGQRATQGTLYHEIFNVCAAGIYFSCSSAADPGLCRLPNLIPKFILFEIRAFPSFLFKKIKVLWVNFSIPSNERCCQEWKRFAGKWDKFNFKMKVRELNWGCEWRSQENKILSRWPVGKVKIIEIFSKSSFFVCF